MRKSNGLSTDQKADLCMLMGLAALVGAYFFDSYSASTHVYNLIFVAPLSIAILVLCALEFILQWQGKSQPPQNLEPISSVVPVIGLFMFYVLTLEWLGFDIGSVIFIVAFLWLHGKRRVPWVLGYGLVFGFLAAWFFSTMLPYPMPMLVLGTEY